MKKIALITFNRVTNYGSLLQTYALQFTLKKMQFMVKIIDYEPRRFSLSHMVFYRNPNWSKRLFLWLFRYIFSIITKFLAYSKMILFNRRYLDRTKKYKCYDELLKDTPEADYYINGSDQLWNTNTNGGINLAYFLNFAPPDKPRISYAASFGKCDFSKRELRVIGGFLKKYKAVSVRECNAIQNLNCMGITNGVQVLDPTLLLTPKEWLQIASMKYHYSNYLLVYNLNRNKRLKCTAITLADSLHLSIVNIAPYLEFIKGAHNLVNVSPNDFITLFANADYIVTDSFHGISFAMNFKKTFICFPAPRYNARLESLLNLVNLMDRMFYQEVNYDIAVTKIDYSTVSDVLNEEKNKSIKFLTEVLR